MFEMSWCSSILMEETHCKEVKQKAKSVGQLQQADDGQRVEKEEKSCHKQVDAKLKPGNPAT
jgi:hypothetical protein